MLKIVLPLACALLASVAVSVPSAFAQDSAAASAPVDRNVFVFGGPFSDGYFGDTLAFWNVNYEDNVFVGMGYQQFFHHTPQGFKFGVEVGIGGRLGSRSSAEVWAGGVVRYDGFNLGDFHIAPALTAGFSVVTDMIGAEATRAAQNGVGSAPFLYYLGPEISISHAAFPDWEVLARVQHRSGGFSTIANLDGSNAATLGLRYKF